MPLAAMSSLTLPKLRLSGWMKLASPRKNLFIQKLCMHTPEWNEAFREFHSTSTSIQHGVSSKSNKLWHSQCLQKQQLRVLSRNVPQVDLQLEKSAQTSEPEVKASEVLENLNAEEAQKLKIIKLEFDVTEQMCGKVPQVMTDENWLQALQMDSKSKRWRYYAYLFKIERAKEIKQKKQEQRRQQLEQTAETLGEREELPSKNTIFFTIRDSTVKQAGNYRLANAMQFGQPLVFDFDYEEHMRHQDCQNLVSQMLMAYGRNRDSPDPFHLIFTSVNPQGKVLKMLQKRNLSGLNFLGTMTDKSYLDFFPRERLVYLSPHAPQPLKEMKTDDVYIVGGFVDKINTKPLSLARAKEQNIRVAKFPLDLYLLWGIGSKSLTLDQVMAILLEQRSSKDWNKAFQVIPKRKLYRDDDS